eukprot:2256272-Pleurochrysis_carterae.AAC.1
MWLRAHSAIPSTGVSSLILISKYFRSPTSVTTYNHSPQMKLKASRHWRRNQQNSIDTSFRNHNAAGGSRAASNGNASHYEPYKSSKNETYEIMLIVPHFRVPSTLSLAYGARPSLRKWGEGSGDASNPVELATHRLCGVG